MILAYFWSIIKFETNRGRSLYSISTKSSSLELNTVESIGSFYAIYEKIIMRWLNEINKYDLLLLLLLLL